MGSYVPGVVGSYVPGVVRNYVPGVVAIVPGVVGRVPGVVGRYVPCMEQRPHPAWCTWHRQLLGRDHPTWCTCNQQPKNMLLLRACACLRACARGWGHLTTPAHAIAMAGPQARWAGGQVFACRAPPSPPWSFGAAACVLCVFAFIPKNPNVTYSSMCLHLRSRHCHRCPFGQHLQHHLQSACAVQ